MGLTSSLHASNLKSDLLKGAVRQRESANDNILHIRFFFRKYW